MLSSSSSIIRSVIEKAENRASVLISLEKSYGSTAQQKTPKKQHLACAIPLSIGVGRQIQTLQAVLCDDSEKLRKALHDSLLGKSIVLTNLKSQTDASKSAKRVKSALGKQRSKQTSKSKLKRLSLCDPLTPPLAADLHTLNSLWCMYMSSILKGAQSEAQLQARLITAELVGAQVFVVKSGTDKCPNKCSGRRGIISAVSKTSFYIAYETMVVIASTTSSVEEIAQSVAITSCMISQEDAAACSSSSGSSSIELSGDDFLCDYIEESSSSRTSPHCNGLHDDDTSAMTGSHEVNMNSEPIEASAGMQSKSDLPVKKKELTWAPGVVVKRILKETCILAVVLPAQKNSSSNKRGREGGAMTEANNGRICLLHGIHHMPFTNQSLI